MDWVHRCICISDADALHNGSIGFRFLRAALRVGGSLSPFLKRCIVSIGNTDAGGTSVSGGGKTALQVRRRRENF